MHTLGRTLAKEPKKKRPGVFFQTPSGHWAINAQWDSVRMSAAKKKKKGNVLTRPYAEKTHCNVKAPR